MPRLSQSRFPCGRLYVSSTHTLDSGLSSGRSHLLSFCWANNSINVCSFDQYHLVVDVRLLNSKKTRAHSERLEAEGAMALGSSWHLN